MTGAERLPGNSNYLIGNDPARWHTDVPTYAKVRYAGVYPGIDLVYYGNQRQLEYDFVVAPNADPDRIRLHFAGAEKLKLTAQGGLDVVAANGEIAFHKPVVYQRRNGRRQAVSGRFTLPGEHTAGFSLGAYDHSQPLIVDPVLVYSTYLGGTAFVGDQGNAIAVDKEGNAYVTGETDSADFPVTKGAYITTDPSGQGLANVVFVTKLNAAGTKLIYSTFIGGTWGDYANGLDVDGSGNAYVTGYTYSPNFPVTAGAYQPTNKGSKHGVENAFVIKLNSAGSAPVYSTYLGGGGIDSLYGDEANALVVDALGNAYIAGKASSPDFPVTPGVWQTKNNATQAGSNAFITKLGPAGSKLIYSTFLGGSGIDLVGDEAGAIAVDGSGNVYVTGYSYSSNFPVTSQPIQKTNRAASSQGENAIVAKLSPDGDKLLYSTYLGGSGIAGYGDLGYALAVDNSGSAYIAG